MSEREGTKFFKFSSKRRRRRMRINHMDMRRKSKVMLIIKVSISSRQMHDTFQLHHCRIKRIVVVGMFAIHCISLSYAHFHHHKNVFQFISQNQRSLYTIYMMRCRILRVEGLESGKC